MEEQLKEALLDASNGGAICFLGAGFSRNAKNKSGNSVPDVDALSLKIWNIIDEEPIPNTSLADLADACEENDILKQQLVELIINSYTLCNPNKEQIDILSLPWRAVFTTNFDDIAEQCVKNPQVVTPYFDAYRLDPEKQPIYHLHGRARDILDAKGDPSIVLSETNYLKLKQKNRELYAVLENEIHTASRIFFIGYSLRDVEIASRLFSIEGLRERSVVITGPSGRNFTARRLKKFGNVFSIGLEGLVSALEHLSAEDSPTLSRRLNYVDKFIPENIATEVGIEDVFRLILSGEFSFSAYSRHCLDEQNENPYCVSRYSSIEKTFHAISNGTNRILVSSDLGNGKSFLLKEIAYAAHSRGFETFQISHEINETYKEIDRIIAFEGRKLFIIDDLIRHKKSAYYIGKRLPNNCALVVSSGSIHDNSELSEVIKWLGGPVREVDINVCNRDEIIEWDNFLERWGFWESKIQDDRGGRIKFLSDRCNSETRAIVVSTFRTSAIATKIKAIVEFFLVQNSDLSKAFIAILINALCRDHVDWSRLVTWLQIDEGHLKEKILSSKVLSFMQGAKNWYSFTSAELADFIFANYHFEVSEIVDVYVKIVRETAYSANDRRLGYDSRENLKELMRFRFLTRLFSNPENGEVTINAVYHRISTVPRIRKNDQFWLQYAMAKMEINDLEKAETFINTALGIAKGKGLDYSVNQIIDQRCRLLFRKNATPGIQHSRADIELSIKDLVMLLNNSEGLSTHPLRCSSDILDFIEEKIDNLSRDEIENLIKCVKLMQSKLPDGMLPKSQKGETKKIRDNLVRALSVLASS